MTETTYPINKINQEFKSALKQIDIDQDLLREIDINSSPDGVAGDFGFHCAPFSKKLRKSPVQIAQELSKKLPIDPNGLIENYIAIGPYVNAVINYEKFGNLVRNSVFEMGADYGKEKIGTGQRIVIDMSSPNIAKRMSIGHLRSTIIGDSLARIFTHLDFEVIKDNHLGDWGTQFGHLLRAIELWGDEDAISQNPIAELQKLYIRISDAGEPDSELYQGLSSEEAKVKAEQIKDDGREWFKRLEQGDPEARARWQQIVDWSLQEFQRMYDVLGVDFDWTRGESYYENLLPEAIRKVRDSGIATDSDGALVVNMEDDNLGVAIIQKSDGATLYLTREIATGIHRDDVENADGMIYVVGEDQKFYFQQFFEILRRMGYPIVDKSKHVYFGMISLPEGKMSTRKGRVILLEDVVKEALDRTRQLVKQRTRVKSAQEREQLVRQVAVGALKWNDLMADPRRSIVFDWDVMLTMEGNSAPYVQYVYARAASLLEGIDFHTLSGVNILPEHETEKALVRLVADFPEVVKVAAEAYNPSKIASHIYELAKAFNAFYHEVSVLKAESDEKKLCRLAIVAFVAQTIKIGLGLLGIEAPNRM
ncbi:MAG: arginine--tRNA ligase [Patescibacteria group bacterium]